ncbi:MAG: DUF721 domain-containing protein [Chitinophagaceae bacterium]|nr:DUF721 domain-containing protein [Chitinophagaceae bacterium]
MADYSNYSRAYKPLFGQQEISLKEGIKRLIQSYNMDDRIKESQLEASWKNLVGSTAAKHTTDMFLFKGILHVKLDSAVVRHELSYAKSKIITHINRYLGQQVVKEIILR